MLRKILFIFTALAVLVAFSLPCLAGTMKGTVTKYDKEAKKIEIDDQEFAVSEEALKVEVKKGDEIQVEVEEGIIKSITK
jgi:hypothetical protein